MLSPLEIVVMITGIAHTQAALYYKSGEVSPSVVTQAVFMLIAAVVTIQLTRAGVDLNDLHDVPELIASEMKAVGWNLESVAELFHLD